jgi:hypothetical protein
MMISKKIAVKTRPLFVCSLAAKILGHSRTIGIVDCSARHLALEFPAFNALELAFALDELRDKKLLRHKRLSGSETYTLTEYGRDARVSVE